jgi:hypothetical protein
MLFKAILVGFPKSQRTLVAFVSVLLSETAGAGNGLNRKSLHRRVKTKGQLFALRFKPRWPVQRKLGRGQDVTVVPSGAGINPAVPCCEPPTGESWWNAR